jgi:hypothetical protein
MKTQSSVFQNIPLGDAPPKSGGDFFGFQEISSEIFKIAVVVKDRQVIWTVDVISMITICLYKFSGVL